VTETFHPVVGGGESQARLLAAGLARRGAPTIVLTRRTSPDLARTERIDDITVHRRGPDGAGQFKKWRFGLAVLPALFGLRRSYDLVLVSGFRIAGAAAVVVARTLGRPVVLKADSTGEMSGEFFAPGLARFGVRVDAWPVRALLAVRNAVLRRADAFVAISELLAGEFAAARIPAPAIHRIPNAVDLRRFRPADQRSKAETRHRLGLPEDAQIVTYTGRLVSYKGLPSLLRVWSQLHPAHPTARLVLVGEAGLDIHGCEAELKDFTRRHGLESTVTFTGAVQNVDEYLRASDFFVFPSENEALPSSLLEAMATRLPIIATPVGAIAEFVRHEINGLLIPSRDDSALHAALERLLRDREFGEQLGREAARTVQERYADDTIAERYLELFEHLGRGSAKGDRP
jgi:glycosyltransferase involved in cell wall biosynthesis